MCLKPNCDGQTDFTRQIPVPVQLERQSKAFPCSDCSALYFPSGQPVRNPKGLIAHLQDGSIVLKDASDNTVLSPG